MILVDSSCWIECFHPEGSAKARTLLTTRIENQEVATCGPVICEVLRGASTRDAERLRSVFSGLNYLSQEDKDWRLVENLAVQLKSRGMQPPLMDLLIAAVAHRHGAQLLHYGDGHFEAVGAVLPVKMLDLKAQCAV